MQIDKAVMQKVMKSLAETGDEEIRVSLFVVSKKDARLKKLALDPKLDVTQRAEKLHQWAKDHRFVAVIESGDKVFAHAHPKYADPLSKNQDLTIDGKRVSSVSVLTDEEAEQLSVIGETFMESILQEQKDEEEKEDAERIQPGVKGYRDAIRQYLSRSELVSDQMQMAYVIARMQNIPGQIILDCLKKMNADRREEERLKEADDKHFDTKRREIEKGEKRRSIVQEEIKSQEKKLRIVEEDIQHVDRTRGIEQ